MHSWIQTLEMIQMAKARRTQQDYHVRHWEWVERRRLHEKYGCHKWWNTDTIFDKCTIEKCKCKPNMWDKWYRD